MGRVNLESVVWSDARFRVLSKNTGLDLYSVVGRCARIWHETVHRRTPFLTEQEINLVVEFEGFALQMCRAGLAEKEGKKFRVRGTVGRTDYMNRLDAGREAGRQLGGIKRAKMALRDSKGHFLSSQGENIYPAAPALAIAKKTTPSDDDENPYTGGSEKGTPNGSHSAQKTPKNVRAMIADLNVKLGINR